MPAHPGHAHVYRPHVPSPENVNSAASVLYQVGSAADDQLVSRLSLFAQIAKVPVFSTVRSVILEPACEAEELMFPSCSSGLRSNSATLFPPEL